MGDIRGDTPQRDDGPFEKKYADSAVLEALESNAPEPMTSSEVGEIVGCSRRTALNRLHDLADDDAPIATKQVGGRSRVWWYHPDRETSDD